MTGAKKPQATITLKRVRKLVCPVTTAGARLSNIAFNLKQRDDLPPDIVATLAECQQLWDEAVRAVPNRWRI